MWRVIKRCGARPVGLPSLRGGPSKSGTGLIPDVLVRTVTGLIRVRRDRHAVTDNVRMNVSDLVSLSDLSVRQNQTATLVTVLDIEHESARGERLLIMLNSNSPTRNGNV